MDTNHWRDAWTGRGQAGTPTGQVKLSMATLNLRGTAFEWTNGATEWRVELEGEKATEEWLLGLWRNTKPVN